jgi:hypothetical protein
MDNGEMERAMVEEFKQTIRTTARQKSHQQPPAVGRIAHHRQHQQPVLIAIRPAALDSDISGSHSKSNGDFDGSNSNSNSTSDDATNSIVSHSQTPSHTASSHVQNSSSSSRQETSSSEVGRPVRLIFPFPLPISIAPR